MMTQLQELGHFYTSNAVRLALRSKELEGLRMLQPSGILEKCCEASMHWSLVSKRAFSRSTRGWISTSREHLIFSFEQQVSRSNFPKQWINIIQGKTRTHQTSRTIPSAQQDCHTKLEEGTSFFWPALQDDVPPDFLTYAIWNWKTKN